MASQGGVAQILASSLSDQHWLYLVFSLLVSGRVKLHILQGNYANSVCCILVDEVAL